MSLLAATRNWSAPHSRRSRERSVPANSHRRFTKSNVVRPRGAKNCFPASAGLAGRMVKSLSENSMGFCFRGKGCMARRDEGEYPCGSATEEQRSQAVFCAKTLRAAGLLPAAGVGSAVTARCGDAGARAEAPSPPWPQPKSLAAGPHGIFRQALSTAQSLPARICENPNNSASHFIPFRNTFCQPVVIQQEGD